MGPPSERTVEKLFEECISRRTPHLDYVVERLHTVDSSKLYQLCTEFTTNRGFTIIHLGNIRGETEAISQVLDKLSDTERVQLLKQKNDWGNTALHCAAKENQVETLQSELDMIPQEERFELLRIPGSKGYTALHCAAEKGHSDIIQCLINLLPVRDRFELLQIHNVDSETACRVATVHNRTETAEFLSSLSEALSKLLGSEHSSTTLTEIAKAQEEAIKKLKEQTAQNNEIIAELTSQVDKLKDNMDHLNNKSDEHAQTLLEMMTTISDNENAIAKLKLETEYFSNLNKTENDDEQLHNKESPYLSPVGQQTGSDEMLESVHNLQIAGKSDCSDENNNLQLHRQQNPRELIVSSSQRSVTKEQEAERRSDVA